MLPPGSKRPMSQCGQPIERPNERRTFDDDSLLAGRVIHVTRGCRPEGVSRERHRLCSSRWPLKADPVCSRVGELRTDSLGAI
jgi:hypothetical protein